MPWCDRPWKLRFKYYMQSHTPGVDGAEDTDIIPEHWIHLSPFISAVTNRLPMLKQVPYDTLINTPDAFTPGLATNSIFSVDFL